MPEARPEGFHARRPSSFFSAGWFRLTLLLVILGLVLLGGLPTLFEQINPSNVLVLGPHSSQPGHTEVQSAASGSSSSASSSSGTVTAPPPPSRSASEADARSSLTASARGAAVSAPPDASPSQVSVPPTASKEAGGRFRIQVGAFTDRHHADRLESRLKADNLQVHRVTLPRTLTLYQLRVNPNGRTTHLAGRLRDLGLILGTPPGEGGGSLIVDPPLPLKRAVDLSRRLRDDGIEVELKRIDRQATLYVIQVGEYLSQSAATEAQADLEERGYNGVVVRE